MTLSDSLHANNSNKSPSMSALLSQKRALTSEEQNYIISSAESDILFNDKAAYFAFQFLIILEGFVFLFFSVADLRRYLHQRHVSSDILLEGSDAGSSSVDVLCEASSHFLVSALAFVAAFQTFGRRSLKRHIDQNEVDERQTKGTSQPPTRPKLEFTFESQTMPPPPAFPPPPPSVGMNTGVLPPPTMPPNPFENTKSSSQLDKLIESADMQDDEEFFTYAIGLNHSNIRHVQKVHRVVALLSLLSAAPLLLLSAKLSSTQESPITPTKLLLYFWQPLQHLMLAWATKALVEDVVGSIEQLKKTKYKHQDA